MSIHLIITGANGMLGRALIQEALKNEEISQVYCISSKYEDLKREFQNITDSKKFFFFNDVKKIKNLFDSVVVNCAFPRTNTEDQLKSIVLYTNSLLTELNRIGCRYLINISSQSVYNQFTFDNKDEEYEVTLSNLYAEYKFRIENLVSDYCRNNDIPYTNVRLASLYSLDFKERIPNRMANQIANQEEILINNNKDLISYLDLRDAASGLITLCKTDNLDIMKNRRSYEVLNLGNNSTMTVLDIAYFLCKSLNKGSKNLISLGTNETQLYNNSLNSDKFYHLTNWKPKFSMENILEELIDGLRKEIKSENSSNREGDAF